MKLLLFKIKSLRPEKLSKLPRTTQVGSSRACVQTQVHLFSDFTALKCVLYCFCLDIIFILCSNLFPPTLSQPNFCNELFIFSGCISSYPKHYGIHSNSVLSYINLPKWLIFAKVSNEF